MSAGFAVVEEGRVAESRAADAMVPWWSFGKTLIAAGALSLVRDGRVALDQALPGRRFTLRQLLQHRAGMTNYGSFAAYHRAIENDEEPWSASDLMRRLDADRLIFVPDEGWEYSNVGYLLVRKMIEECCEADLDTALRRLVFHPLGIESVRVAAVRGDLVGVEMGDAGSYHPGWVYHGLVVGRLVDAALALDRLMRSDFLPPSLLASMRDAFALGGPLADRPWQTTGYGLGTMIGTVSGGRRVIGHTGGGPGSVIAVYHHMNTQLRRTIAAFAPGTREGEVERVAFGVGDSG